MKPRIHYLYILGLIFLGAIGCQKDKLSNDETEWKRNDPRSVDEVRTIFAQTLSKALNNEPLRRYVHTRMQESHSTNYEFVYIAEKNKVVFDGKTFAEILTSYADESVLERYGDDFFQPLPT
ncbi:MAG: hypothetical protein KF852_13925 [Saprospiraceae bacterium]|nr:hypothetical protein [Saprospiraceae bacterium]